PADDFEIDLVPLRDLRRSGLNDVAEQARGPIERHQSSHSSKLLWEQLGRAPQSFGLLLLDGLSMREELVAKALNGLLGGLPICGGSAGDDLRFEQTHVWLDGQFIDDAGALLLCRTARPFERFRTQHFAATEHKLVVTGARPEERVVTEFNGVPAVEAYAEALGLAVEDLTPAVFVTSPVVVALGDDLFVRSVANIEPNGCLRFFCAIDEGLILTIASAEDMVANLDALASSLRLRVGEPEATLAFDCILRRQESRSKGLVELIDGALERLRCTGFATYGEQFDGMHVNNTMTGVAIGPPKSAS
ncbi:MAG: FIST N-terminal domain-containing protein, partial [Planctomycetota bacterium]